jgi:hypothetical protein
MAWLLDGSVRGLQTRRSYSDAGNWLSADLTARTQLIAGTTHQSASAGLVGRWSPTGTQLPLGLQRVIAPTVRRASVLDSDTTQRTTSTMRAAIVGSIDLRRVRKNVTLSDRQIDTRLGLVDLGFGLQGEWGPLAVTTLIQHRSREFAPRGVPIDGFARYWTLQLMYRPSGG